VNSELSRLLDQKESETLEFKGPRAHLDALARAVCGMLNQQGGVVVWGVGDDGSVIGVQEAEQRSHELNDFLIQNIHPRPLISVSSRSLSQKDLVIVDVPQGADKPYSFRREISVRVGSATLRATSTVAAGIVEASAAQLDRWEREPMAGFAFADCSSEELKSTRQELSEKGRFGVDVPADDEELLRNLSLFRNGQFMNGAVVLFATNPTEWLPNVSIRLISYVSDKTGQIANDTILQGPAVRILKEAITVIQQRTGYSSQFDRKQIEREDKPAYALFALREGSVNAVVHRDYSVLGGSVRVELFPDRLTIQNAGTLPTGWNVQHLKETHGSHPRNPDIARVFYVRGLMEQLGMGTQRLISACRDLGAKPPVWKVERDTIALTLHRAPEPEASFTLSARQAKFVKSSRPREVFRVGDYATACGVSERQARRELAEMQTWGLFQKQGKGPSTSYVRTDKPVA
jgi:ATP-dependent DNA helicase RecG